MILQIIYFLVVLASGFGLGRIKNKSKLAAVSAELNKLKASMQTGAQKFGTEIKSKV